MPTDKASGARRLTVNIDRRLRHYLSMRGRCAKHLAPGIIGPPKTFELLFNFDPSTLNSVLSCFGNAIAFQGNASALHWACQVPGAPATAAGQAATRIGTTAPAGASMAAQKAAHCSISRRLRSIRSERA